MLTLIVLIAVIAAVAWCVTWLLQSLPAPGVPAIVPRIIWVLAIVFIIVVVLEHLGLMPALR